jgi:glutamine amidotransferase
VTIGIVDYQAGNLGSLSSAMNDLGIKFFVSDKPSEILESTLILIPGVGSMSSGMKSIRHSNLDKVITGHATAGKPVLGICLGMHLLATSGLEGGKTQGLNLIPGEILRLKSTEGSRVPHMGWDEINYKEASTFVYFAHSYFFKPDSNPDIRILSAFEAGKDRYPAHIQFGNVAGIQFHPEKSGAAGLRILLDTIESLVAQSV